MQPPSNETLRRRRRGAAPGGEADAATRAWGWPGAGAKRAATPAPALRPRHTLPPLHRSAACRCRLLWHRRCCPSSPTPPLLTHPCPPARLLNPRLPKCSRLSLSLLLPCGGSPATPCFPCSTQHPLLSGPTLTPTCHSARLCCSRHKAGRPAVARPCNFQGSASPFAQRPSA